MLILPAKKVKESEGKSMGWKPTLQQAVAPLNWLNVLAGLGVFEYPPGHPRPVLTRICNVLCMASYFWFVFWEQTHFHPRWVAYEKITMLFVWYINIVVAFFSVILAWVNMHQLANVTQLCSQIDETLEALGTEKEYGKLLKEILVTLFIWFSFMILLFATDFTWLAEEFGAVQAFYVTLLIHMPIIINSVVDLTFVGLARCVAVKMGAMNKLMNDTFKGTSFKDFDIRQHHRSHRFGKITIVVGSDSRNKSIKHFIETIKQVHLQIVRLARQINQGFRVQILLELAVQITIVTGSLYNLYFILINPHLREKERNEKLTAMSLWAIVNVAKVIVLNGTCSAVTSQAKRAGRILREFDASSNGQDLRDEVQQFSLQMMLHPLYFTACGFVRLDNEFTRAFVGTVATYLVILIQMSSTPAALKSLTMIESQ